MDHRTPSSRVDVGHLDLARSGSRLAAGAGTRASTRTAQRVQMEVHLLL